MKMFAPLQSLVAAVALCALCVQGSPLARRDVIAPKITSPNAGSVWPVGSTQTVTWDTSNFPPVSQITNIMGKVILGQDANNSLNLDFDHPLAQNFNLTDGSVQITVPTVAPADNYLIVLFGDSGNTSPDFSITNISVPASPTTSASTTSDTPITTPIPITGSTITGGDSTSTAVTTDSLPTGTSTDATTSPAATSTTPGSTSGSASTNSTASPALATTTTASTAWSIHRSGTTSMRTLSLFICAGLALVLV
ncbi:hypothetical protein BJ912DRAFT_962909 [Pholiota molesta]|nr:hypothetical protein BJ912DRAFT_962909 [Pholiota molesta]